MKLNVCCPKCGSNLIKIASHESSWGSYCKCSICETRSLVSYTDKMGGCVEDFTIDVFEKDYLFPCERLDPIRSPITGDIDSLLNVDKFLQDGEE